jgi:hypothetical protein
MTEEILATISNRGTKYPRRADFTMECALSAEFARRHGWRECGPFGISALSGIAQDPELTWWERRLADDFPYPFADHGYFYRADDGRPAALAVHLYDAEPEKVTTWAAEHGLQATFPTDFPSWWYPGWTTLVVYQRAKARA